MLKHSLSDVSHLAPEDLQLIYDMYLSYMQLHHSNETGGSTLVSDAE